MTPERVVAASLLCGILYIWGYVDVDMSTSKPPGNCEITGSPNKGDFLGWFDMGLQEPSAPNVVVPHAGRRFDFSLGIYP